MFSDDGQTILPTLDREAQVHRVPFDGGQVTWRCFGSGEPLVLLHGGHGRWSHWARNIKAWSGRFSVWVPDLPGYGDSDVPPEPSLDSMVDVLLHTLDALVPRATALRLVAFSFGSLVAAPLAVRRGGIVQLALLGPAGHGGARRPRGELRSWRGLVAHSPAWVDSMRHNLLMHMIHGEGGDDDLDLAVHIHADACLRTRFHSKLHSRAGRLPEFLAAFRGPLMLVWGEHDVTADPVQAAALLSAGRRDCQVHIVADAGHWVQYEAASQVNDLVLSWLRHAEPAD